MYKDTKKRLIWLNGSIFKEEEAKINVLSPTAQFGANVFEGIRCYWNKQKQQLYAFRLVDHYNRLKNSMKILRMDDKYTVSELKQAMIDIIQANKYKEDIAVRQTIFIDGMGSWSAKGPIGMFIAPIPKSSTLDPDKLGYKASVSSWQRISDRNLSPKIKLGANYMNSRMGQLEALNNGYDTTIFMNDQGKISEGPGSCIFIVRDGKLITPPITSSILESITRATIIELSKKVLNFEVVERDIDRTELYICDEIFLCGSAIEILPVLNVDGIPVGRANPGKLTCLIRNIYLDVVRGKKIDFYHWLTSIY